MARIKLRFIQEFVDPTGKVRRYFRRHGRRICVLPGEPGSDEFMRAYAAALKSTEGIAKPQPARLIGRGTIAALVAEYKATAAYTQLRATTQATYSGILSGLVDRHGHRPVATMRAEEVRKLRDAKQGAPAAANNLLRMLRLLMRHAVDYGWRRDDPTRDVRPIKRKTEGFLAWTEADITAFERGHPEGSRARLALALLLYTGQRRSDVIRMGRQHVRDGELTITQQKTGAVVTVPLHARLLAEIDRHPRDRLTFLLTAAGKPFSAAGFGNWFREVCDAAGLKGLSAHGLRKAASRRLAEAGCTDREIMAITGHETEKEVTRYTRAADRERMARAAADKLARAETGTKVSNPKPDLQNEMSNSLKRKA